jgi:hypothetical protein
LSHGESGRSGSVFGFNDFITSKLDALGECLEVSGGNGGGKRWVGLGEKRKNGDTTVTPYDGNGDRRCLREVVDNLSNEGGCTNNIEGGYTKKSNCLKCCCIIEQQGLSGKRTSWGRIHRAS